MSSAVERYQSVGQRAEFRSRHAGLCLEVLYDSSNQFLAILGQFTITFHVKHLPKESKPRKEYKLFSVDTDRQTQTPLIKKFKDLNDMLC
jgi:hypothetical protein